MSAFLVLMMLGDLLHHGIWAYLPFSIPSPSVDLVGLGNIVNEDLAVAVAAAVAVVLVLLVVLAVVLALLPTASVLLLLPIAELAVAVAVDCPSP